MSNFPGFRSKLAVLMLCAGIGMAQAADLREWIRSREKAILAEYVELLSIPGVAANPDGLERTAQWLRSALERRGVSARFLRVDGAPPAVYGEWKQPAASRTLLFYAHYDGQPVDASEWTATSPFEPALYTAPFEAGARKIELADLPPDSREVRLYARSAADDRAPIQAMLTALDWLRSSGAAPGVNLKFFFEGEEERGSGHLREILEANRDLLEADGWLFCDGPVHQSRRPQVVFGARGSVGLELTVYGARKELHSGHYGNWAPNPAQMLVNLLATMRRDDGRVTIADFYDGVEPLGDAELSAIAELPDESGNVRRDLLLGRVLGDGQKQELLINQPVLNLRGIRSAGVGNQARNVVPATATASMDIRLVKGVTVKGMVDRLRRHIQAQGYYVTGVEPDAATLLSHPKVARLVAARGYNAVRMPMDHPLGREVVRALEQAHGVVYRIPTLGGSLPLDAIAEVLQKPVIVVPTVNHDNNQHSHNENLRLGNLWDGVVTMEALYRIGR